MKIIIIIVALSTLFYLPANAQTVPDPVFNIPSPNAQSLQIFGAFPQSSYTGVPAINIPLYTLTYAGISVPITLSYNSNLVKPDNHPGWVGLGWCLNAGGAITRVVNGKPDDMTAYYDQDSYTTGDNTEGLFYHYADLAGPDWSSAANMQKVTNDWYYYYQNNKDNKGSSFYWETQANPHTVGDYEPDEFSFNFLGYSGKFYLDETGNWKVRSDQNFHVEVSSTMTQCTVPGNSSLYSQPGFSQFTITDNKGIKYVFGGDNNAIEYSNTLFTQDMVPYVAKTWNLTQIILPNLEAITFTYDQGPLIAAVGPKKMYTTQAHNPDGTVYNSLSGIECFGSVIVPSYLKSISTRLQTINFYHTPSTELEYDDSKLAYEKSLSLNRVNQFNARENSDLIKGDPDLSLDRYIQFAMLTDLPSLASSVWHKLDRIDVADANNNLNKRFDFQYTAAYGERLKLLSVTKSSPIAGQANDGVYQFGYNTTQMLPEYLSLKTDYWNNYNGTAPDYSSYANFNLSRAPNATYETAELLNKVTYPTGGWTTYQFEPHKYSKLVNNPVYSPLTVNTSDGVAGGLRISTITNYDIGGKVTDHVNYYYDNGHFNPTGNHLSSGILGGPFNYDAFSFNNSGAGPVNSADFVPSFPGSQIDNGSNIGYSEVTEQFADGSYAVSRFSNFDNGANNNEYMDQDVVAEMVPGPHTGFISHSFERGRLLERQIYTTAGTPLSDHTYQYLRLATTQNSFVRAINPSFRINVAGYNNPAVQPGNPPWGETFSTYAYEFLTYPYLLSSENTITYQTPTAQVSQAATYTYDPLSLNVVSTTTQNSKNQTVETDNTYPADMVSSGNDPLGIYSAMVSRNIISPVVQSVKKRNGVQESLTHADFFNPSPGVYVPSTQSIQIQNNNIQTMAQFTAYDDLGNLLCKTRPNGVNQSFQWGYNNSFPVAKVDNAYSTALHDPANATTGMQLPLGSPQSYSLSFNITSAGPVFISMGFNCNPSGDQQAKINCTLTGPNGYSSFNRLCMSIGSSFTCGTDQSVVTISSLPPGQYQLTASYFQAVALSCPINIGVQYPSQNSFARITREFYYEGFEDSQASGVTTGQGHTGNKYTTDANVSWTKPTSNRAYLISYWYLNGSTWSYSGPQTYNGPTFTMSGGSAYDDVRIYPADAQMTTYTYDPLAGMTSSTDAKGETTTYEYDRFQQLMNIKDKDGNIVKHIDYHYQGQ